MKYSASQKGFYPPEHPPGKVPSDAVEISDEVYFSLLAAQDAGKQIEAVNGQPVAVDRVAATVTQLTPRQIRMALSKSHLRGQIETAISAGDQDLKDWYQFSTYFDRHHPQVLAMATALNVSEAQLDQIWALGATL